MNVVIVRGAIKDSRAWNGNGGQAPFFPERLEGLVVFDRSVRTA